MNKPTNLQAFPSWGSAILWMRTHATGEACFRSPTPRSSAPGRVPFFRTYVFYPGRDGDYGVEAYESCHMCGQTPCESPGACRAEAAMENADAA